MLDALMEFCLHLVKGVFRWLTGMGEIERICSTAGHSPGMTLLFEDSIARSRQLEEVYADMQQPFAVDGVLDRILLIKNFRTQRPAFRSIVEPNLRECLRQMQAIRQLNVDLRALASERFDRDNGAHQQRLFLLWELLKPEAPLVASPVSDEWKELGFQSNDPHTDFRGMGMLGLENLIYFAEHHPETARVILAASDDPVTYYPFAATGINFTLLSLQLLESGELARFLYNYTINSQSFSQFYCYVFYEFHVLWLEMGEDIMSFPRVKGELESRMRRMLGEGNITAQVATFVKTRP